jgi:hypothetical protein
MANTDRPTNYAGQTERREPTAGGSDFLARFLHLLFVLQVLLIEGLLFFAWLALATASHLASNYCKSKGAEPLCPLIYEWCSNWVILAVAFIFSIQIIIREIRELLHIWRNRPDK